MLTLTLCVLRFDRAESFWMPTGLTKISGSFNPLTEKEAPATRMPLLLFFFFNWGEPGGEDI